MAYEDLLKDSSASFEDGNYFVVTVPDLTPGTIYPLEFRWKYKDGTFSEWGCVKTITAASESIPKKPSLTATYFQGIINVTWNGKGFDTQNYSTVIERVEIYLQDTDIGVYFPSGSIQYNGGAGGTLSIPVKPGTYKIKGRAVSKSSLESVYSDEITVTAKLEPPAQVTAVNASWSGTDFIVTFSSDPSLPANQWLSFYSVTLTSGSDSKVFTFAPTIGSSQKFSISLASNRAAFGVPKTSFSGSVSTVDIYGNVGAPVTFGSASYVNNLAAPVLSATEIQQGYSISYATPTSATYDHIEIEEVESNASTAPTTGYSVIFSGIANPAPIIRPNQNKRWVRARFADNIGSFSPYSSAIAATPLSPVTVDNVPPSAPASGSVTAGIDNSAGATIGFNAYLNISWNAVSDSTLRGYRIRFRENGTTNPYSYVDSPGAGTTFRLNGLSIGTTYEVGVASYDEYNNTSSAYTSLGTATATGTPFIGKNVTTVGYFGASATGDTGTFKFGYGVQDSGGTKRGLVFNSNNYWYIDSAQSALFKLGGDTNNYIEWDGSTFIVQGDIRAKAGNFSGNVQIQSGGSLYSGTLTQAGALSGAGFILNNSGLTFNSSSVNGITTINGTTGLFTTTSANIGGWTVGSSSIAKTSTSGTITLNSTNAQITLSSTSYNAGIATPDTNSASDIVFWAGGGRSTAANFYVRADGTVKMSSAIITGYATSNDLSTKADTTTVNTQLAGKISTGGAATDVNNNTTTITGNKIRTGSIEGNSYSYTGTVDPFSNSGMSIDLTNNRIRSPQFAIVGANAYFKGELSAATGSFNGSVTASTFNLTAGSDFWKSDGSFQFGGTTGITKSTTGAISIGSNVNITGTVTASAVSAGTFNILSSGRMYNGNFEVTAAGKLIATNAEISGTITASSFSGGSINISNTSFSTDDGDSDSGAGSSFNTSQSNAFYSSYSRAPFGGYSAITCVGFNAIGLISTSTAGVVSSWYPYYDGAADLGVKYSSTYNTNPFRWRNLRLTDSGNIIIGGDGSSDTPSTSITGRPVTRIYGDGRIFANTLGTATTSNFITQSSGFLRVNTSSSRRYKRDIIDINTVDSLNTELLLNIPVRSFIYNNDHLSESDQRSGKRIPGLIAEEVEEFYPAAVDYNDEGIPERWNPQMIIPGMLDLIQKQNFEINSLKQRLDALEG